jgi:hypothetical protein
MQPAMGKLTSKDPHSPKPIYVLIEGEDRISVYSEPPPFFPFTRVGFIGDSCVMRRKKRGFLFSNFELEVNGETIQYFTDNKFGDLLNLFVARAPR